MKAVLVIDMPYNCGACKLSSGDGFHLMCPFISRGIEMYIKTRHEGCPLRELPERKAVIGIDGATGIKELDLHGRQKGWNACIDKILDN